MTNHPWGHVFPVQFQTAWTTYLHSDTAAATQVPSPVFTHVLLDDAELGVHRISKGTTHDVCTLADGARAWEAVYAQGSYKPTAEIKGGFGFYLAGPRDWRLAASKECIFSYAVLFEEGFDFVKGGKLPGIFGGEGNKSYACTGGRREARCSCFDLRLMWRAKGEGEIYAYLPITETNERRLLEIPGSHRNPDFGFSVGRGAFSFTPGNWSVISQRVKLNDVGQENGELELWVDGISVIKAVGIVYRSTFESVVQGLHFQTFFGGGTPDWASPKDQRAWFTGISGAIVS